MEVRKIQADEQDKTIISTLEKVELGEDETQTWEEEIETEMEVLQQREEALDIVFKKLRGEQVEQEKALAHMALSQEVEKDKKVEEKNEELLLKRERLVEFQQKKLGEEKRSIEQERTILKIEEAEL